MQTRRSAFVLPLLALTLAMTGCLERELKPLNPCLVSGVVAEIAVNNVDKVDLLFVVDNSGSMAEEQEALKEQFPKLIRTLTSGIRRDAAGNPVGTPFPPAKDLHLAVVTTDMGLVGISGIDKCNNFGDDGKMQRTPLPGATGCPATVPPFLSYTEGAGKTPETLAAEFGCIATLGTDGCGFEQQLESGLKALWPAIDIDPNTGQQWLDPMTGQPSNRITFLRDSTGAGRFGHGDGANANFLRNEAATGLSLIAIVVVTDEEDCSSQRTDHFTPPQSLAADDPLRGQDLNLRCYYNEPNLYRVERYVQGFKALRPGNENLVIFAAIAGVPVDLVTAEALAGYDLSDMASRNAFYDGLLADNRMQEVVDQSLPMGSRALKPSCDTASGTAYPPRRIVDVARGFEGNGVVQSICQDDFGPAMDAIIKVIAKQLGAVCLPRELVRDSDGKVGCNVVWELPLPNTAPASTPTACSAASYLDEPEGLEEKVTPDGRARCVVTQLAVQSNMVQQGNGVEGWFYDDFSEAVKQDCTGNAKQRVAFTANAVPPTGVTVQLECLSEVQSLAVDRIDVVPDATGRVAQIGDSCEDAGNAACTVMTSMGPDNSMFCHMELNVCVRGCTSNYDCPAAWVCDARQETIDASGGGAICVNPTCGSGE